MSLFLANIYSYQVYYNASRFPSYDMYIFVFTDEHFTYSSDIKSIEILKSKNYTVDKMNYAFIDSKMFPLKIYYLNLKHREDASSVDWDIHWYADDMSDVPIGSFGYELVGKAKREREYSGFNLVKMTFPYTSASLRMNKVVYPSTRSHNSGRIHNMV